MEAHRTIKLAAIVAALFMPATASANSIGLNFVNVGDPGIQNGTADALAATESAGVPAHAQQNWNNLGRWGQTVALIDSSGAATGVTATWDSANTWNTGVGSGTPDNKLMHGYLDATGQANVNDSPYQFFWNENKPEVYVTGLSSWLAGQPGLTQYNVVVYIDGDATEGRIGEYWLQSGSGGDPPNALGADLTPHVFVRDSANFAGTYTQVPFAADSVATAAAGNYIVFSQLSADGFILRTEERSFRAQINGLQIVAVPPLRPGDVDGDNDVDLFDLAAIQTNFRTSVASRSLGDLDGDGFVEFRDYLLWKANYPFPSAASGTASGAPAPEPASWTLLLAAGLGTLGQRRWRLTGIKIGDPRDEIA